CGTGATSGAGACARPSRTPSNPTRLTETPGGSFLLPETIVSTVLDTDLITPLAAYLRLRGHGRASFLLESVDRGRLGRHSLVGCGSRLVDVAAAEAAGEAVVGYVGYDWIATLEPTVPPPAAGPD